MIDSHKSDMRVLAMWLAAIAAILFAMPFVVLVVLGGGL